MDFKLPLTKHTLNQFSNSSVSYAKRWKQWGKDHPTNEAERKQRQHDPKFGDLVEEYYNIVTPAYEFAWSQYFHPACFAPGDNASQSIAFALHQLACKMELKPGMKVLDLGCGIGAPAREIARFVGCEVIGISITQYQVNRAIEITLQTGLSRQCTFIHGDFMDLPFPAEYFDAAYGLNALCHAPSMPHAYAGVNRVLKRGAPFGIVEFIMTPLFDPSKDDHIRIRDRLEAGSGIVKMPTVDDCRNTLKETGFHIYHDEDYAQHWQHLSDPPPFDISDPNAQSFSSVSIPTRDGTSTCLAPLPKQPYHPIKSTSSAPIPPSFRPWYFPWQGRADLCTTIEDRRVAKGLKPWRRRFNATLYSLLEHLHLIPRGSSATFKALEYQVDAMTQGGETGIFSPLWWFVSSKTADVEEQDLLLPYSCWLERQQVRREAEIAEDRNGKEAADAVHGK